jgi:hypothetical protein
MLHNYASFTRALLQSARLVVVWLLNECKENLVTKSENVKEETHSE